MIKFSRLTLRDNIILCLKIAGAIVIYLLLLEMLVIQEWI